MIVTNLIMQSLAAYELRHLVFLNNLRPLLNTRAPHLFHELHYFAYSPYDIMNYDLNVQYPIYLPHDS